eukprot:1362931-Karenia_brevis.AAC.1
MFPVWEWTAVAGLAEVSSGASVQLSPGNLEEILPYVDPSAHEALRSYLEGCCTFDVVYLQRVYDLRGLSLTWTALVERVGLTLPRQRQGFPVVGCREGLRPLLELCSTSGRMHEFAEIH